MTVPLGKGMSVAKTLASILKKEGVEILFCYPNSKIIDEAALLGMRPIVCPR